MRRITFQQPQKHPVWCFYISLRFVLERSGLTLWLSGLMCDTCVRFDADWRQTGRFWRGSACQPLGLTEPSRAELLLADHWANDTPRSFYELASGVRHRRFTLQKDEKLPGCSSQSFPSLINWSFSVSHSKMKLCGGSRSSRWMLTSTSPSTWHDMTKKWQDFTTFNTLCSELSILACNYESKINTVS